MTKVLAPCLEIFWCLTFSLTEADEGISEAVWVKVWQARIGKRLTKNCPGWEWPCSSVSV